MLLRSSKMWGTGIACSLQLMHTPPVLICQYSDLLSDCRGPSSPFYEMVEISMSIRIHHYPQVEKHIISESARHIAIYISGAGTRSPVVRLLSYSIVWQDAKTTSTIGSRTSEFIQNNGQIASRYPVSSLCKIFEWIRKSKTLFEKLWPLLK